MLKELIGLPQALAELGRLDLPVVGIPSYFQTGHAYWQSCLTTALLLFYERLLLVLSLLSVGGGEKIKF